MTYLAKELQIIDFEIKLDVISFIEKTFEIEFDYNDLKSINSIQELSKLVCSNVKLEVSNTSTKEIAIDKFRKAYYEILNSKIPIEPNTLLKELFFQNDKDKIKVIKQMENELKVQLDFYTTPIWGCSIYARILLIFPLILIFPHYVMSIILIASTALIIYLKFIKKTFTIHTVNQLMEKIIRKNYCKIRDSNSINPLEINDILIDIISIELHLDKSKFDKYSRFR